MTKTKRNAERSRKIFENVPKEERPAWAAHILSRFDKQIKDIPAPVLELYQLIDDKEMWITARIQADKIRQFRIKNNNYNMTNYLILAEFVANATYNTADETATVENVCGHYIVDLAIRLTEQFDNKKLTEEVQEAIFSDNLPHRRTICHKILYALQHELYALLLFLKKIPRYLQKFFSIL